MTKYTMQGRPAYRLLARRGACANTKFEVFFDTIEDFNGKVTKDFLIVRPKIQSHNMIAGVCVVPEVKNKIALMRGYRHQLGAEVWQAPAGFVEPKETPEHTALRELQEETRLNCVPEKLVSLGTYFPDAGLIEGRVAMFLARCDAAAPLIGRMHGEAGTGSLHFFDRNELEELLYTDETIGGSTLVACFRYLGFSKRLARYGDG